MTKVEQEIMDTIKGAILHKMAEEEFKLTAEDIGKIFNKVLELQKNWTATVACYADVAEWFNEQRKKD